MDAVQDPNLDVDSGGEDETPIDLATSDNAQLRKKHRKEIIRAYFANRSETITKQEASEEVVLELDDELKTVATLQHEAAMKAIDAPREYQTELFERAKQQNTIAVLATGSGKTMISILLIQWMLDQETERRAEGRQKRVVFFLVNSVALAYQQSSVLKVNLRDGAGLVTEFVGSMGTDFWDKDKWLKNLVDFDVIVCTAALLNQALDKSFFNIGDINLLIFDEAHHAKQNHPYAILIRDHYFRAKAEARPRIFGMTASPVDTKSDVKKAAGELETLLDSKIATTSDGSIGNYVHKATDARLSYARLKKPFETPLTTTMLERFGSLRLVKETSSKAIAISRELGAWASDLCWQIELGRDQDVRVNIYTKGKKKGRSSEEDIEHFSQAITFVRQHHFGTLTPTLECLSSKVLALHEELAKQFERPTTNKCLIFVDQRIHAHLLQRIFDVIGGPNLTTGLLFSPDAQAGDVNMSLKKHILEMTNFRKGISNCVFATSVAEEGIDVPDCNVVIRFDLCKTMIQYVQSRGRARHKNSRIVHMHELHNSEHVFQIANVCRAEIKMKEYCTKQSEDRLLHEYDDDLPPNIGDYGGKTYTSPSGALLNWDNSLVFLGYFVATLPTIEAGPEAKANFIISLAGCGNFICEVILPEGAPIRSAFGQASTRKALAKRSAAFEMCILLIKARHLNEHLMPTAAKLKPLLANAHLALKGQKGNYDMRIKPDLWSQHYGNLPERLFLTTIDVSDGLTRPYTPMGVLTMEPLPEFPEFPIYVGHNAKVTRVLTKSFTQAIEVDRKAIEMLATFTLCVFRDVFIKEYERNDSRMSYFTVPLVKNVSQDEIMSPELVIDWSTVEHVVKNPTEDNQWTSQMKDRELRDRYWIDRGDAGRRAYSTEVVPDLEPNSPVPAWCPPRKAYGQNKILDYSMSWWKQTAIRKREEYDMTQPVIDAELIDLRYDLLSPPQQTKKRIQSKHNRIAICPQPWILSSLPAKFVAMCFVFPPIIHRLEDYMIALEASKIIGITVNAHLALEACTKDSNNSEDHNAEQINFRPGMGANYERLEFLGDCFLKMATTIALYVAEPDHDEYWSHCDRMDMLCNKTLFLNAVDLKLHEYIRTEAFSRRSWYPQGLKLLKGKGASAAEKRAQPDDEEAKTSYKHSLNSKSIADVCEAMIGAAFVQHYRPGQWQPTQWDDAVKAVTKVVNRDHHRQMCWTDYAAKYVAPESQQVSPPAVVIADCEKIEKLHDYKFRNPMYLETALTHPSLPRHQAYAPNYQRLEFLGDSLLDTAFVSYLFFKYPQEDPQWLTEHKGVMVGNRFLAAVCVKIGLHKHMRLINPSMKAEINNWVEEIEKAERDAKGSVDYWTTVKTPHKCLADLVEAYVGAVFIDSGFDFNEVQRFFDVHIRPFFLDVTIYDNFGADHPMHRLNDRMNIELGCHEWHLFSEELKNPLPSAKPRVIAAVMIHDVVVEGSEGQSSGSKNARLKAAQNCVEALAGLNPSQFRTRYGCGCSGGVPEVDGCERSGESGDPIVTD